MKKILAAILMILCIPCAVGCNEKYGIIPFENKDVIAECCVNGRFDVIITKEGEATTIEVASPEEIGGLTFHFSKGESYVISGDVKIPITKSTYKGIYAIAFIFNIREDMALSATSQDGNGTVDFSCQMGEYSFIYDSKGYLYKVHIKSPDYEYEIDIKGMKIQ